MCYQGCFSAKKKLHNLYVVLVFILNFLGGLGGGLIAMVISRELPTANLADVLLVAETTSRCHNWLRTVLWPEQLSASQ